MSDLTHITKEQLEDGLPKVLQSPNDSGVLKAIVIRPDVGLRESLTSCELSATRGVHGDRWAEKCWMTLEDGRPHPDVQVCIMNARMIDLIAGGDPERWPLAGDNLFFDLNITHENLSPGQCLSIGSAILEITEVPHNGCGQFRERYGKAARQFVNSSEGRRLRLRGIYAKVVKDGSVAVGDEIRKSDGCFA